MMGSLPTDVSGDVILGRVEAVRCGECGHHGNLWGSCGAAVEGPIGEDGQLLRYSAIDDDGAPSIECQVHLQAGNELHYKIDGRWCVPIDCPDPGHSRYSCPTCSPARPGFTQTVYAEVRP